MKSCIIEEVLLLTCFQLLWWSLSCSKTLAINKNYEYNQTSEEYVTFTKNKYLHMKCVHIELEF